MGRDSKHSEQLAAALTSEDGDLSAGSFGSWLERTRCAQLKDTGADVPCGGCTACCRSSYFIHIGPDEAASLARIPSELLFPAPGLPDGNVLLGFDEEGRCPMLKEDGCSIYADRPLTCRSYDCRVFPATGIEVGDADKAAIAQRARRWKFGYASGSDRRQQAAVRAAAVFLQESADRFPAGALPSNSTQLAILAIEVYELFLSTEEESGASEPESLDRSEVVKAILREREKFEARRRRRAISR
jgi:Fe-S-cluster containining protein